MLTSKMEEKEKPFGVECCCQLAGASSPSKPVLTAPGTMAGIDESMLLMIRGMDSNMSGVTSRTPRSTDCIPGMELPNAEAAGCLPKSTAAVPET